MKRRREEDNLNNEKITNNTIRHEVMKLVICWKKERKNEKG